MSGAMRKIGEYLGLLEDTGVYDDEYDEHAYAEPENHPQQPRRMPAKAQPAPVADISQRRRTSAPASAAAGGAQGTRLPTLHPRTCNKAPATGEYLPHRPPARSNLRGADDADVQPPGEL